MTLGEKIDRICELEQINLKQFSVLTGISYTAARAYRKNRYGLSVSQINKICSIPRFSKYRNFLLSVDAFDSPKHSINDSEADKISRTLIEVLADIEKAGLSEHAKSMLKILLEASKDAKENH